MFALVFQVAVVSLSSSHCWFLSLNTFDVFDLRLSAFPYPTLPPSFLPLIYSVLMDAGMGVMAGLRGFANHWSGILSGGWLPQ